MPLRAMALYLRHAPDHPGRWRLELRAVSHAPRLRGLTQPTVVRLREGGRLQVDGSSQTGRIVYATGDYEPATSAIIRRVLRPGDLMVDVGANIGFFTVVASRAVGPAGRVIAFEPVAPVRRQLESNVRLNGLSNVEIRADAAAASAGEVTLFAGPDDDTGLASLRPLPGGLATPVRQARLDDALADAGPVRLVKIDVEGAELEVLRGFETRLRTDRPDVILEITDEFLQTMQASADMLREFLASRGYRVYWIQHDGRLQPIDSAEDLARCPDQFNAYCTASAR